MRSIALIAGLAALAAASPTPQVFPSDQLADLPSPPISDVPSGAGQDIIPLDVNAVVANAVADIIADPTPDLDANIPAAINTTTLEKRTAGDCAIQPTGYGPTSPDVADDPNSFLSSTLLAGSALTAPQWVNGFHRTFQNKQASVSGCSYQGYKTYQTYDVTQAAADCKNIAGCKGFNIFYERDPTKDPGSGCPNPASTTVIKVSFWGNLIGENLATNKGQYRDQFQVVIAGSNGYNVDACETAVQGWTQTQLGSCSINAPKSYCLPDNSDSYLTVKTFSDGNFDNSRCKAQCDIITKQSPDTPCNFFTSYMQVKNGQCGVQQCAFYKRAWDKSYCTNTGDPVNKITIAWASSFTNNACDGTEFCNLTPNVLTTATAV
ncbi:hypothetical protein KCU78_g4558, partial [Aureobasidium melanogenum]